MAWLRRLAIIVLGSEVVNITRWDCRAGEADPKNLYPILLLQTAPPTPNCYCWCPSITSELHTNNNLQFIYLPDAIPRLLSKHPLDFLFFFFRQQYDS